MKNRKQMTKCLIVFAFAVYLLVGIFIYQDYGISADEPTERISTLVNVKYILKILGIDKETGIEVPDLTEYKDKYYGTFLQMPAMIFEFHNENLGFVFWGRHLYTFILCLIGCAAFFLLCKKLLKSDLFAMMGTAMIALYPRFFSEQFYNIKDMVFVATFMIAMFVSVELIESKFKWNWIFCFSAATAVSANVRIVGIIFLMLMLGYLFVDYLAGKIWPIKYKSQCAHPFICGGSLLLLFLSVFVLILPITWENPIRGIYDVFTKFSNFDDWNSTIVFMGKVIHKEELPWYYVPVWMLISVPVWYLILFAAAIVTGICVFVKKLKIEKKSILELFSKYKYIIWCILLIAGPWLGIVIMHSTLYNGWRHCYFMLPPLVLLILFEVEYLFREKRKVFLAFLPVMIIGAIIQIIWIINNHPYEMVYFNNVGKHFASSFDRDYWHLSSLQAVRYILEVEEDDKFSVETPGNDFYRYLLTDEERERIIEADSPLYKIETYRGKTGNEVEMDGYEEIYSILVDDFKVATIFKKNGGN